MTFEEFKKLGPKELEFLSLLIMCVALPTSIFLISISQFGLVIAWLWKGDYKSSIQKFLTNKTAVALSSIYFLHLFGLIYTNNFNYALNDLRIKLPILILPFILSSFDNLSIKQFNLLIWLFILSTLVSTLVSLLILLGLTDIEVRDIRQSSILISHIRLSLMVCISIFFCGYYLVKNNISNIKKLLVIAAIAWLISFLFIIESGTGIVILFIVFIFLLIYFSLYNKSRLVKIVSFSSIFLVSFFSILEIRKLYSQFCYIYPIDINKLEAKTILGNYYEHHIEDKATENGNYVGLYQNWEECKKSWRHKSKIEPQMKDLRGQDLQYTMFRYLTSLGLRKDSVGVSKLTEVDVKNIENGVTNYKFSKLGIKKRLNDLFYEYEIFKNNGDASGHSVYMRFQFWSTAINIIKSAPIIGVGTGDINDAFLKQYEIDKTILQENYRLRAHNQFLSFAATFGILGLIIFTYFLYQIYVNNKANFYLQIFLSIIILSFMNEDTLETSTGAVLFSFLICLLSFNFKSET